MQSSYSSVLYLCTHFSGCVYTTFSLFTAEYHYSFLLTVLTPEGETEQQADLHSSSLSLFLTSLQCLLFSVCASVPFLPLQYLTFVLQVLNRSFLYGGNAAFISIAWVTDKHTQEGQHATGWLDVTEGSFPLFGFSLSQWLSKCCLIFFIIWDGCSRCMKTYFQQSFCNSFTLSTKECRLDFTHPTNTSYSSTNDVIKFIFDLA